MIQPTVAVDFQSESEVVTYHSSDRSGVADAIVISCYENEIPAFVEAEMDRLYGNLYSSLVQLRVLGKLDNVNTYAVRKGGVIITLFLFQIENRKVNVLNEVIKIEEEEVRRFANTIFAWFRSTTLIVFQSIQTDIQRLPTPYQRFNCLEDVVLTLPNTAEEYLASLGKSTRKTVQYYMNKLKRNFPSFRYDVYAKEAVNAQHIQDIIALNKARMTTKNKISIIDQALNKRIIALVEIFGHVGVATIDGRVCGGSIGYRVGANDFMGVSGHAAEYDDYRLGTLCCYLAICDCIARGGKECHFQWGQEEYKYRFLGVRRDLDKVVVYRSRMQLLLNIDTVLKTASRGYLRRAKLWLRDEKQRENRILQLILKAIHFARGRGLADSARTTSGSEQT